MIILPLMLALGSPSPSDDAGGRFSPTGVQFFLNGHRRRDYLQQVPAPLAAAIALIGLGVVNRPRP